MKYYFELDIEDTAKPTLEKSKEIVSELISSIGEGVTSSIVSVVIDKGNTLGAGGKSVPKKESKGTIKFAKEGEPALRQTIL